MEYSICLDCNRGDVRGHINLWTRLPIMRKGRDDHGRSIRMNTSSSTKKYKKDGHHLQKKLILNIFVKGLKNSKS